MLLTAKEARKFVEDSIDKKREEELKNIEETITAAIYADKFSCEIEGNISAYAKCELEKLGYDVQYLTNGVKDTTSILW